MTLNGVMALFGVISSNPGSFRVHSVKVHVRYLISWWSDNVLSLRLPIWLAVHSRQFGSTWLGFSRWPLSAASLDALHIARFIAKAYDGRAMARSYEW